MSNERWKRLRADRALSRGAVALEFAIILPLLLMLLLGVTTTGLAYSDHLAISNASREASRFGSALDYSTGATVWADSVQSRALQIYANGTSTLTSSQVCVQLESSTGTVLATPSSQGSCGSAPSSPSGMATGTCVVKVWIQKPATINLGVARLPTINLTARSVAYYGRVVATTCPGS